MIGKITDANTISSNGVSYGFELYSVINGNGVSAVELISSKVEFEADGNKAIHIYLRESDPELISSDLTSTKIKIFVALGFGLLGFIPLMGLIFGLISLGMYLWAVIDIKRLAPNSSLIKNLLIGMVIIYLAGAIGSIPFIVFMGWFIVIPLLIAVIVGIYFYYKFYKELSLITMQGLFIYAFAAMAFVEIVAVFSSFFAAFFALIYIALETIAWIKISQINPAAKLN